MSRADLVINVVVYTLGRKFPRMIGKFPNGKPIPFGPFTYVQAGVLVGGVILLMAVVNYFTPPIIPTLLIGAAIILPSVAAARRIGFSMARTSSRMIWSARPWIRRAPISTGGRPTTTASRAHRAPTGSHHRTFELEHI